MKSFAVGALIALPISAAFSAAIGLMNVGWMFAAIIIGANAAIMLIDDTCTQALRRIGGVR